VGRSATSLKREKRELSSASSAPASDLREIVEDTFSISSAASISAMVLSCEKSGGREGKSLSASFRVVSPLIKSRPGVINEGRAHLQISFPHPEVQSGSYSSSQLERRVPNREDARPAHSRTTLPSLYPTENRERECNTSICRS